MFNRNYIGSTLLCQFLLLITCTLIYVYLFATDYVIIVIMFYMKTKCNLFLKSLRCITSEYGKTCYESNLKDTKTTIIGEMLYILLVSCMLKFNNSPTKSNLCNYYNCNTSFGNAIKIDSFNTNVILY